MVANAFTELQSIPQRHSLLSTITVYRIIRALYRKAAHLVSSDVRIGPFLNGVRPFYGELLRFAMYVAHTSGVRLHH